MKYLVIFIYTFTFFTGAVLAKESKDDTTPTLEKGAKVFWQRCVLCHGSQGMGEGILPLKIKNYPNTNLATAKKVHTKKEIKHAITYGAMLPNISEFMPPMGNELTWTEMESVSWFVYELRTNTEAQLALLGKIANAQPANKKMGAEVYRSRCVLCHGKDGEGDGRMAKVIKNPPPFDLTKSIMPQEYLKLIITKGGEPVNRSKQMPPWGEQLSEKQIDAVVLHLLSIRD